MIPIPIIPNGWATHHVAALQRGETVSFRPRGHSMEPRVPDNSMVRVEPVTAETKLDVEDVVLVRLRGRVLFHKIVSMDPARDRFVIGNNKGRINGPCMRSAIYGRCVEVLT